MPFFSMLRDTKAHLYNSNQPSPAPSSNLSAQWPWQHTIVGIITNSDDRIPDVLSSFGLKIGSRRVGKRLGDIAQADPREDVSFVVLSYDTGYEKPEHQIFDAAIWMLEECLAAEAKDGRDMSTEDFEKLMVGDNIDHDVLGARRAGWNSLLLDREGVHADQLSSKDIASVPHQNGQSQTQVEVISDLRSIRFWQSGDG